VSDSSRLLVTVRGGVAEAVAETVPPDLAVEVIDYDNLEADPLGTWGHLSRPAKEYVRRYDAYYVETHGLR